MTAKRKVETWSDRGIECRDAGPNPGRDDRHAATRRRPSWQEREARLVEALLEFTTIAGLFALLFALFVLFGAAQNLSP